LEQDVQAQVGRAGSKCHAAMTLRGVDELRIELGLDRRPGAFFFQQRADFNERGRADIRGRSGGNELSAQEKQNQ